MSEQLIIEKQTLEGIADAVREKKGTTGKIPVANLENEIRNISGLTIDGVSVTGSRNFETKTGYTFEGLAPVHIVAGWGVVECGNKIYAVSTSSTSGCYVFDGTSWADITNLSNPFRTVNRELPVYNGEFYFFNGSYVCKFDGTTVTQVTHAVVPYSGSYRNGVAITIYRGEIHVFGSEYSASAGATGHWKYIPSGSTSGSWTSVSTMPITIMSMQDFVGVYNDSIIIRKASSKDVYKFDGTSWSKYTTLPYSHYSALDKLSIIDGYLYMYGGADESVSRNLYRFDGVTWTKLDDLPFGSKSAHIVKLKDSWYLIGAPLDNTTDTMTLKKSTHYVEV